jgi:hypothetical protein
VVIMVSAGKVTQFCDKLSQICRARPSRAKRLFGDRLSPKQNPIRIEDFFRTYCWTKFHPKMSTKPANYIES